MAPRLSPRVIASLVVVTAVLGTLLVVYLTILAPQLKARRRLQRELDGAEARWESTIKHFGYSMDPQTEITLLAQEVNVLETAVRSLAKISDAKLPTHLFPEAMFTEDVDQLVWRYQDHLDTTAEAVEERVDDAYRNKRVPLARAVEFTTTLSVGRADKRNPTVVVEQANKKMASLLAAEELCYLLLDAEIFALRELDVAKAVRSNELWVLSYEVTAEVSTESLVRLSYLMRERQAYYYFENLELEPMTKNRGNRYFSRSAGDFEDMDEMELTATISTIRSQTQAQASTGRREQARANAEARREAQERRANSAWMHIVGQLEDPDADKAMFGEKKPWWKFW